jgi:TRAP-type mannitol/chloroaromatic compound transport system permease large subunit
MTGPVIALVMLALFIVFIFLGFPIAFTLMGMGILFGFYAYYSPGQAFFENNIFYLFTQNTFSIMNNDVLISIPLFLFMGYIIERANILDKLFLSLQVALRHVPGSMAVAALITCALFATATGIVGAVVTLMGLLALPSAIDHADRLRCHGGRVGGQAVCRRHDPRDFAGHPVPDLRGGPRRHQPLVGAQAQERG